jgi:rsbT antagonist protein RsbS
MPPDPDDSTIAALQERVLDSMERHAAKGLILDISAVETLDSYFARTVSETAQMVVLMGGRTIIVGMRPAVAMTATQMGLKLGRIETALTVDRALDLASAPAKRPGNYRQ